MWRSTARSLPSTSSWERYIAHHVPSATPRHTTPGPGLDRNTLRGRTTPVGASAPGLVCRYAGVCRPRSVVRCTRNVRKCWILLRCISGDPRAEAVLLADGVGRVTPTGGSRPQRNRCYVTP